MIWAPVVSMIFLSKDFMVGAGSTLYSNRAVGVAMMTGLLKSMPASSIL